MDILELSTQLRTKLEHAILEAERLRDIVRGIHDRTVEVQQEAVRIRNELESEAQKRIELELIDLRRQVASDCLAWISARLDRANMNQTERAKILEVLSQP